MLRFQRRQQGEDKTVVVRLASCQRETNRQPTGIDNCMNLGRQSASRPAHQLLTVGCDARAVMVHADDRRINHLHSGHHGQRRMAGSRSWQKRPFESATRTPFNAAAVCLRLCAGVRLPTLTGGSGAGTRQGDWQSLEEPEQ